MNRLAALAILSLSTVSRAADPFVFWHMAAFGVADFRETIFDTGIDAQGGFYQLVRQPVNGDPELVVLKNGAFQVQEFLTQTSLRPINGRTAFAVAPSGESYVFSVIAHPSGEQANLIKVNADGTRAWTRVIGVFTSANAVLDVRLHVDTQNKPAIALLNRSTSTTSVIRIERVNASNGTFDWAKTFSTAGSLGDLTSSFSEIVFVENNTNPTVRGLSLANGTATFTSTVPIASPSSLRQVRFNPFSKSYYATGFMNPGSGSRSFIAGLSNQGALSWLRQDPANTVRAGFLVLNVKGQVYDVVGLPGPIGKVERIAANGTLLFSSTIPNFTTMPGADSMDVAPTGETYVVHRNSGENTAQITRFTPAGALDWQLNQGAPFWGMPAGAGGFTVSGIAAPRGAGFETLRIATTHLEAPGSSFSDLRTFFYGPPPGP